MTAGTLTGLAIGDALGMPFETQGPWSDELQAWQGGYGTSGYHGLGPGQWTDDTQMSLALGRSILANKFFDPQVAAKHYLQWYQNGPRGIGKTTEQAMQKLASGASWSDSGVLGAEGNGTAMRASPIGLHLRGNERLNAAAHWARIDAAITHKSFEAYEGSAAVAVAVCYLVTGGRKDKLVEALTKVLKPTRVRFAIEDSWRLIQSGATIQDVLRHHNWEINGVGAHVVSTVPAAVSFFLLTPDYVTAVTEAVTAGGDTDSTASVTGALAGSHYGYEGIPKDLIQGLERADEIRELELALAK